MKWTCFSVSPFFKTTVPSFFWPVFLIWRPALTSALRSVERWSQPRAGSFRWARVSCCLPIWGSAWYGQTVGSVCTPRGVGLCGYCFYRLCLFLALCFFFLLHSFAILAAVFVKSLNKVWTVKQTLWKLVTEVYAAPLGEQRLNGPWPAVTKKKAQKYRWKTGIWRWSFNLNFSKSDVSRSMGFFNSIYHSFQKNLVT